MSAPKYTHPLSPEVAQWADTLDEDARYWFEERAGIYEYDGGMSRSDAEREAQKATEEYLASRSQSSSSSEKTPKNRK